jgi:hypothetical protein
LDPFSPIGISPIADIAATTDPLSIEPLSPPSAGARPIDAGLFDSTLFLHRLRP